jgi:hypothetical protein
VLPDPESLADTLASACVDVSAGGGVEVVAELLLDVDVDAAEELGAALELAAELEVAPVEPLELEPVEPVAEPDGDAEVDELPPLAAVLDAADEDAAVDPDRVPVGAAAAARFASSPAGGGPGLTGGRSGSLSVGGAVGRTGTVTPSEPLAYNRSIVMTSCT